MSKAYKVEFIVNMYGHYQGKTDFHVDVTLVNRIPPCRKPETMKYHMESSIGFTWYRADIYFKDTEPTNEVIYDCMNEFKTNFKAILASLNETINTEPSISKHY